MHAYPPLFIILFITNSLFSASAIAASKSGADKKPAWFEIEVIIFANNNQEGLNSESWVERTAAAPYSQAVTLKFPNSARNSRLSSSLRNNRELVRYDASGSPIDFNYNPNSDPFTDIYTDGAYSFLPKSGYRLRDIYTRLARSTSYEPLLHIAWRQPTVVKERALPVFVYEGMTVPDSVWLKSHRTDPAPPSSRFNPRSNSTTSYLPVEELDMGPKPMRLFGTIRMSVSRYLHIDTDLHLKIPLIEETEIVEENTDPNSGSFFSTNTESQPLIVQRNVYREFTLSESRRMRSKEVHHLDHPLLAVIVLVTPYELPVVEPIIEMLPIDNLPQQ